MVVASAVPLSACLRTKPICSSVSPLRAISAPSCPGLAWQKVAFKLEQDLVRTTIPTSLCCNRTKNLTVQIAALTRQVHQVAQDIHERFITSEPEKSGNTQ
jgi:hypothetical protein